MNKSNTAIMFGIFSSMILLISLMSLQQTVHATPLITKFGIGYAHGKHNAIHSILEAKEMQVVLYLSGIIYHIV